MLSSLLRQTLWVLPCLLYAAACGILGTETDNPAAPEGVDFLRSSEAYLTSVDVPTEDQEALQQGNRAFALDLYRELAASAPAEENLFISPYSISTVMAMTYAGARGQTEAQMAAALHFDLDQQALHPAMNHLSQHFDRVDEDSDLELQTLNSIWLQNNFPVEDSYLDVLSRQYDAGVYLVDFDRDAEGARRSINDWVYEQTEERIDELFPPNAIDATTALALTNTIYLSAPWKDRFDPEDTQPGVFTLANRDQVSVDMMSRLWHYPFSITPDWHAVELPYRDVNVSMIFILPNEGEFEQFEAELDDERLTAIVDALPSENTLYLAVPKFSFESSSDLKTALQRLGMTDAFFTAGANFSGISSESPPLFISAALHKTYVGIDEEGTVAAAATGEVSVPGSVSPSIKLDRPFLFLIWDHDTRTVLFLGRLVRPDGPVVGQAPPPVSDAETICQLSDGCPGRSLSVEQCVASFDGDDSAVVNQCADCYRAEADLSGPMPPPLCQPELCVDECPAHPF